MLIWKKMLVHWVDSIYPKINTDQILQDIKYLFKVITDCEKMAANNEDESGKYGNVCVANIVSLCKTFTLFIHILNSIGYEIPPAQIWNQIRILLLRLNSKQYT